MFVLLDAGATPAPARILVYRTALQFSLLRRRWKPQTTESGCAMRKAIQRLSDIDRAALLLRDVEGLTVDEVAAVLRNSQREVRERAHRGRLLLIEATADDALPRAG
jgi:DNA-directed RNA polymerase specialized sigma24 family protein